MGFGLISMWLDKIHLSDNVFIFLLCSSKEFTLMHYHRHDKAHESNSFEILDLKPLKWCHFPSWSWLRLSTCTSIAITQTLSRLTDMNPSPNSMKSPIHTTTNVYKQHAYIRVVSIMINDILCAINPSLHT